MKSRFPLLLALLLSASGPLLAAGAGDAERRLRQAIDEVVAITDQAKTNRGLPEKLRPVLEKFISFEAMTRRAVGPGWRQFSAEQRTKSTDLFTTLVIRTYSAKLTPGEHPVITFKTAVTPAPGRVEIPTTLLYEGSRYAVTYRMEPTQGWQITDVVIEGVSLVANYRGQFDAQFQRGGADAVLKSLTSAVAKPR